jgi:RNA-directed DNA polymerase
VRLPPATRLIVGFEHKEEAERFLADLAERFAKFGLGLKAEKTRLIEFGRNAARERKARGLGKPDTFDFLGFTHICGKTRAGKFQVLRKTISKRCRSKLRELNKELKRRRHLPIPEQGKWLRSVVQGHLNYYAVPGNYKVVSNFVDEVKRLWLMALRRRSQKSRMTWDRFGPLVTSWLPRIRILHPYPEQRFAVMHPR